MDRMPLPAPFPMGSRVRYIGTRESYTVKNGEKVWCIRKGMEVEISSVWPGRRGTLRKMRDADGPVVWEDTGEPILDETRDGTSSYTNPSGMRCSITRGAAGEWEVVR